MSSPPLSTPPPACAPAALPACRRSSRLGCWVVIAFVCLAGEVGARAVQEYAIKSAFLYNFAQFISWPASAFTNASAPVVFGIIGDDPFGEQLREALSGETVNGRPIELRHYTANSDLSGCHLLFVARSDSGRIESMLREATRRNILTVGEANGFIARGGMINFVLINQKVRFEINAKALDAAGLKASSKLLAVAVKVTN